MAESTMSFEDYLELIKNLRLNDLDKSKVDKATDKILKMLDDFAKKINDTKDGKVESDAGYDLLDAIADMQDPATYAKIMELLNEKLAKDGDIYNISTPEDKMLGLANRYVNRAQEARYNRNWKLFGFYLRSLAYFVPLLIEKARMREETLMKKIESNLQSILVDNKIESDVKDSIDLVPESIQKRAKFLIKKNGLNIRYIPVLYMTNLNKRKDEYFIFAKPNSKEFDIFHFLKNEQQAFDYAENLMNLKIRFKKYYRPEYLKSYGLNYKVLWQNPELEIYTGNMVEEQENNAENKEFAAAHISKDKLKRDLKNKFKLDTSNSEELDKSLKNGLYIDSKAFHNFSKPYIIENYIEERGWYLSPYDSKYLVILEED